MKKIWSYLAVFLAGFSTMAIIALKWFNGDDYSVEVKKIKNKKTSGDNEVTIPIQIDSSKMTRKDKRGQRKLDRQAKKN